MLLLTQLDAGTSSLYGYAAMFVLGLGLGLVMQVLVLAVQNAVDYADLGVATSSASLFRSMGGSLGTAALGAVFTARLTTELAGTPAARVSGGNANPAAHPAPARGDPRHLHRRVQRLALDRLSRRRRDPRGRLPALVADRGTPAAPDRRDGGRRRGLRHAVERRLAARADSRARPPGRPPAHAGVHRAHRRRIRCRPCAGARLAARPGTRGGQPRRRRHDHQEPPDRRRLGPRAGRPAQRARARRRPPASPTPARSSPSAWSTRRASPCRRSWPTGAPTRTRASTTRSLASPASSPARSRRTTRPPLRNRPAPERDAGERYDSAVRDGHRVAIALRVAPDGRSPPAGDEQSPRPA